MCVVLCYCEPNREQKNNSHLENDSPMKLISSCPMKLISCAGILYSLKMDKRAWVWSKSLALRISMKVIDKKLQLLKVL